MELSLFIEFHRYTQLQAIHLTYTRFSDVMNSHIKAKPKQNQNEPTCCSS